MLPFIVEDYGVFEQLGKGVSVMALPYFVVG
jgi:hypothetical protein